MIMTGVWRRLVAVLIMYGLLGLPAVTQAQTVLFVPMDDRPVSFEYTVETGKAAQLDLLVPPAAMLASRDKPGDPDKLWQWVEENASRADALVLASDSLLYGGLVDSRTHDLAEPVLNARLAKFRSLKTANPTARLYVFGTVMRTPTASAGGVEPAYYEQYGGRIFQLTALQDKEETVGLTRAERRQLKADLAVIPPTDLADWLSRRQKNFAVNAELIALTRNGDLDYLVLGRDDTAPYSQTHREGRALAALADGLNNGKFATFPGADQLGMIMLARAYNNLTNQLPIVKLDYAPGAGDRTVPRYEDQPVGKTIVDHIIAAGGIVLPNPHQPDLVLAVNTPFNGLTREADSASNGVKTSEGLQKFVADLQTGIGAGKKVAVADIAFGNGADNSLMAELANRHLLDKLTAYSGWNTASNTIGYVVSQGMMAGAMNDPDRKRLLAVRYLDDWAYQANIRNELNRDINYPRGGSLVRLDGLRPLLTAEAQKREGLFARQKLWLAPDDIKVSFPWNRMFEIQVQVKTDGGNKDDR